jgi:hypothetical protein
MTFPAFIDLVLTPIAGGLGAAVAISLLARQQPEKYEPFSSWVVRLGLGAAVAIGLFILKLV